MRSRPGRRGRPVDVTYEIDGTDWKLAIADNGVGKSTQAGTDGDAGLGTTIVKSLAKQLGATVETGQQPRRARHDDQPGDIHLSTPRRTPRRQLERRRRRMAHLFQGVMATSGDAR